MQDADAMLAEDMGRFYDDPLGFVMYAFPWGKIPALSLVKLPEKYRDSFDMEYGPDQWACELLEHIGEKIRENRFDLTHAVPPVRTAVASGHGIGKSAVVAWIVHFIMSTRPNAKGVITANTSEQLSTKTWAEIAKWHRLSITGHWFDITTGKGAMRMRHKDYPESWMCVAQTCREENSEAFAGLHAADSTPFYIFDEASAIPEKIWEVSEGGMTDGEPMWFVFGNPTRNSGSFHSCFNRQRHRWHTMQVDSRSVQITNKKQLQQWVEDYGEDSDFVRVRVRGVFPNASSLQFIPSEIATGAAVREMVQDAHIKTAIVGVDVARFGDDQSVIVTRIGRDARSIPALKFRGVDTMQLASHVVWHIQMLEKLYRVVVFVDGGGVGGGVIDRLRQLNVEVIEVNFGWKAGDDRKYANKRAEMWGNMREWLAVGCIENSQELITDLHAVEYGYNVRNQLLLESKEDMKKRGLASPDSADALALTFAFPVADEKTTEMALQYGRQREDYNPYDLAFK